jgi:hypothetical protein
MSGADKVTRRTITVGGAAAIGAAIVAGGIFELPKLFRRKARGPYAGLVNRLDDPERAAIVGRAIPPGNFEGAAPPGSESPQAVAAALRKRLAGRSLQTVMAEDSSDLRNMVEVEGWVLPLSLLELCLLAAKSI